MNKNILGEWGSGLNDADYACALAALGVLESTGTEQHRPSSDPGAIAAALEEEFALGERTPVWRKAKNVNSSTTIASWRESVHQDAEALAAAWRQYRAGIIHPRLAPRLAVMPGWSGHADLFDFGALCAWLTHPDVGLEALVLAEAPAADRRVLWHWPLRVGVPAGTENAEVLAALRGMQGRRPWVEQLSECYPVGAGRDSCDVLILTKDAAQHLLGQPRTRIRASVVVCLEDPPPDLSQVGDRCAALRDRLQAAGSAFVGRIDPAQELGEWYAEILREVSHDVPIHAALWRAGRRVLNRDSVILGDPPALENCRILAIAERQDRVAAALTAQRRAERPSSAPPGAAPEPTFGGPVFDRGPLPPAAPGTQLRRLADELRGRMFSAESVDGVGTVGDLRELEDDIERERVPRWIQAGAWRDDAPQLPARSLAPGRWNLLGVHIGPTGVRRADQAFPDSRIDFSRGDVSVTVQLELAGAALKPLAVDARGPLPVPGTGMLRPANMRRRDGSAAQLVTELLKRLPATPAEDADAALVGLASSAIILPPAGDSTLALFAACPQSKAKHVDGRIAIIHNNRVLQTARLSVATAAAADQGAGVNVAAEATIHARDDDLDERRDYDVAMQVSDVGGRLHLTIQRNGSATTVQLEDLNEPISAIQKVLKRVALEWDYSKPMLKQEVFADSLYALAAHGSALEQHLRKLCGNDIDHWERIHLVPSTYEFLPLEYVYDGRRRRPTRRSAPTCWAPSSAAAAAAPWRNPTAPAPARTGLSRRSSARCSSGASAG